MPSPSKQVKRLFDSACKTDKALRNTGLRSWARSILKDDNHEHFELVDTWWDNKHRAKEKREQVAREKHKGARIRAEALATKAARSKNTKK